MSNANWTKIAKEILGTSWSLEHIQTKWKLGPRATLSIIDNLLFHKNAIKCDTCGTWFDDVMEEVSYHDDAFCEECYLKMEDGNE